MRRGIKIARRPRNGIALAVALACGFAAGPTRAADALANAQRAYAEVDYVKCREEARRALEEPADRAERIDAYRFLGLCEAALGDTDAARESFKRMIAIDREAKLPDGLSPRFTSSYREAKGSFLEAAPLALVVDKERRDGGARALTLKLTDDLGMVRNIAWRAAGGSSGGPLRAAELMEVEVPAESDVTVLALDKGGGELVQLAVPAHKPNKVEEPPPPADEEGDFPWLALGGVSGGVVVVAAAVAGVVFFALQPRTVSVKTDVVFGDE